MALPRRRRVLAQARRPEPLRPDVEEQHVEAGVQISGAYIFVPHVCIRNFALIERVADPSDRVGIGPRHPHGKARRFRRVVRHIRCSGNLGEVEAEFRGGRQNGVAQSGLGGKNPRPGRKLRTAFLEFTFGDLNVEVSQTITGGEK